MSKIVETKLKIESWDENTHREFDDGSKVTRADVTLTGIDDRLTAATMDSVMYYRPDGTGTFLTYLLVTGTLDGRTGTVVLQGDGSYDGKTARMELHVVTGTGELAGLSGTARSESTHEDYPNMPLTLEYDIT
jgi:hypothetical protein